MRRLVGYGALLGWLLARVWGAEAAPEPAPVTVGVVLPLSGPLAPHGTSILAGVRARVDGVNRDGGVAGRLLELRVEDTGGLPEKAVAAVALLADDPAVLAVVGPQSSGELAALRDAARALPVVVPKATGDGLVEGNPWLFRIIFNNTNQAEALAAYLGTEVGFQRYALVTDARHRYAVGLAARFRAALTRNQEDIVYDGVLPAPEDDGEPDYGELLRALAEAEPEVVFLPAYEREVVAFARQAEAAGLDAVLCGGDSWDLGELPALAGPALAGGYFVAAFSSDGDDPRVRAFLRDLDAAGHHFPDSSAALGYDAVEVLREAFARADTLTREDVRAALAERIRGLPLVTGRLTLDERGEADKPVYVLQLVRTRAGLAGRTVHAAGGEP